MAWLASDFLLEVRQAIGLAASGATPSGLTDANLLPVADREIQTSLVPLLMSVREEFYVLKKSYAITAGTTRVRIPGRTIAGRIRDARLTVGTSERRLIRYESEDKTRYFPLNGGGATPAGYYVEGEWLVLLPQSSLAATLDVYYFGRPGRLTITSSEWDVVNAITTTGSVSSVNLAGSTTPASLLYDIVRADSGFAPLIQNVVMDGTSLGAFDCASTVGALIAVGDYIVSADKTPVVPLPVELHGVLVARTAAAVLRQLGKYSEANAETKHADELSGAALAMLAPRVTNQPKVAIGKLFSRRRVQRFW